MSPGAGSTMPLTPQLAEYGSCQGRRNAPPATLSLADVTYFLRARYGFPFKNLTMRPQPSPLSPWHAWLGWEACVHPLVKLEQIVLGRRQKNKRRQNSCETLRLVCKGVLKALVNGLVLAQFARPGHEAATPTCPALRPLAQQTRPDSRRLSRAQPLLKNLVALGAIAQGRGIFGLLLGSGRSACRLPLCGAHEPKLADSLAAKTARRAACLQLPRLQLRKSMPGAGNHFSTYSWLALPSLRHLLFAD